MESCIPAELPGRPPTPRTALAKRLAHKFTMGRKQSMDASKGFYTPAFAAPVFPATDPHVLTRQTTSSHTPRVLVKGRRGPSRSSNSVQPDSKVPSTEPPTLSNPVNPVSTHQPSSDAVAGLPHAAPAPSRFRRKEHPRSWTQQMVKDPLVERFEKLRLPVAPATLPIPSSRSPTNFSFPLSSHDSTTAAKQAWNRMAVSHPILPVFQEQSQSRSNRRDALPQAYRSRPGQQSTGPIAIDEDSDEDLTVVSARPVTNFSNTNFFQSGDREPSNQRRRLQIDRFLRKNPARRSRSPSASSSGSDDELTPGSSEDSHLDLAARVAQAERRGQPYGYHEKLQEEQDHLLAERMQHDEGTAPSLFSQRLCSSATKSASQWQTQRTPHRKTTPISSLKRAIARAGTRDDPINLDSDSDNIGEARGKPMELDETSQLQSTGGRDCAVCGDSVKVSNLPSLPDCAHRPETCPDCYSDWISAQLQDSNWGNVKCPGDGCNTALSYYDIRAYASPEVFQRYDTFIARAAFSQDPNFRWCRACDSGQIHLSGVEGNIFTCVACGHKVCVVHENTWHEGETCDEFEYRSSGRKEQDQRAQEAASLKAIGKLTKKCPGSGCIYNIEKNDGCDHMTCSKCRYEFCWLCLADYNEIRRLGNTAHRANCQYHSGRLL